MIHNAGGVAVLAHPGLLPDPTAMVERLVPAGLDGVEVVHPKNPENLRLNLRALAQQHNLVMTGGSDFHGLQREGDVLASVTPPEGAVEALRERRKRYAKAGA
jgi:predicted metal-dependent phosphoesterase TrpH